MAGLGPAIHVLLLATDGKGVDARHKAGHDDFSKVGFGYPFPMLAIVPNAGGK